MFPLALLHSVSYLFFLHQPPSSSFCKVFDSTSSNIDKVLLINPSVNVSVFGDFKVQHKARFEIMTRSLKLPETFPELPARKYYETSGSRINFFFHRILKTLLIITTFFKPKTYIRKIIVKCS